MNDDDVIDNIELQKRFVKNITVTSGKNLQTEFI
jgi:hypothetical protein